MHSTIAIESITEATSADTRVQKIRSKILLKCIYQYLLTEINKLKAIDGTFRGVTYKCNP